MPRITEAAEVRAFLRAAQPGARIVIEPEHTRQYPHGIRFTLQENGTWTTTDLSYTSEADEQDFVRWLGNGFNQHVMIPSEANKLIERLDNYAVHS